MPWDGAGTFTRDYNWESDRDLDLDIDAERMDGELDNYATAMNKCLVKDGQNTPTADLPMDSNKHTGVGNASARTHYAATGQVQDSSFTYATDTGSANTYVITPSPAITAYAAGQTFEFIATNACTGASTLNVNSLGAKTIKKNGNSDDLATGDVVANQIVRATYDGTVFQININQDTDISGKADKISGGTENDLVTIDASENIQDSGLLLSGVARRPGSATTGNLCEFDASDDPVDSGETVESVNPLANNVFYAEHQETSGTGGGATTTGSWFTRKINTEVINQISGASFNTGTYILTLPAGTYLVEAWAHGYNISISKINLYNNTDTSIEAYGSSEGLPGSSATTIKSTLFTKIVLASSKDLLIQQQVGKTIADGLGRPISYGTEVYAGWKVIKIA